MFGRWSLYDGGRSVTDIIQEIGLTRKRIDRWVRLTALPERNPMAPKASLPALTIPPVLLPPLPMHSTALSSPRRGG
jgi:hypothetical protein